MLKSSSEMNKHGVGLGLTICKRICESMNGWVKAESVESEGSTFKLSVDVKYLNDNEDDLMMSPNSLTLENYDEDPGFNSNALQSNFMTKKLEVLDSLNVYSFISRTDSDRTYNSNSPNPHRSY
jgi:hypothetical protein